MTEQAAYGSAGVGFMDGAFTALSELRLPVTDMGFQLGDMCYDVVHVWKGRFFRLDDHLERWQSSLAERRYDTLGYDREAVADVLHGCVARAGLTESMVTVIATGTTSTGESRGRPHVPRRRGWMGPWSSSPRGRDRKLWRAG